ncbi:hypothetical protein Kisp02_60900 [Kineosporia sp. NBRC 101731]|nr:hypothetical protein Kisp02_60900 [Kineosporia sp. NBRC 101731]
MYRVGEEEGEEGSGHRAGQADTEKNQRQGEVLAHRVKHKDLKTGRTNGRTRGAAALQGPAVSNGTSVPGVTPRVAPLADPPGQVTVETLHQCP